MLASRPVLRWALIAFLIAFPFIFPSNWADMAVRTSILVLSLLSVVILTGWVGQISLAQAALMGVGAFTAAQLTNHLNLEFPFHAIAAGAAAALVAIFIGLFALRIRGLYLAIATLAFQWAMEASFLEWHPFSGGFNGVKIDPLKWPCCDFSDVKLLYFLVWPTTILLILMVANLRDSKTGRAWFAIRSSEVAAKTLGINVTNYKLRAFAVSGFIIGVAGSMNLNYIGSATPLDYNFQRSILFVAIAVLGGIGAIAGAVVGAIAYVFSDQYLFTLFDFLKDKTDLFAGGLLIFTILQNPAGIIGVREQLREKAAERHARKERRGQKRSIVLEPATETGAALEEPELVGASAETVGPPPVSGAQHERDDERRAASQRLAAYTSARGQRMERSGAAPMLEVRDITIRFGGVVANDAVSFDVRPGEICGLIGPNGAGKTTNFNCVNGLLVPNSGSVRFMGQDITNKAVHDRAKLGMARTFQLMRLFPRLTVFENLMVGTHLQNDSGFASNLLMLGGTRNEDRRNRDRVKEVMSMLGISDHAESRVAGLPFGVLRLVELGRALVTQPRMLLLDEPASGLDVSETDAFAEILFKVRDEMGHTIFIIEHDMRLVMMICDYLYVLEFGRNLAEGFPQDVQSNPAVIAAYLGEESVA